ncbi:hypothetical protein HDE68_000715 [Pedobacter cryoconitis]|uniref:Uncharacterized protein n=1 Tax=Pedobacter cryoconitis TaxID=188932 RepID=A0A7W8ZJ76_9SPHI|nr:hypothetical protein [Pedobacter cryoconitis]MBB5634830.1 hypothetical protein [Pedobacter cryoconitis]
MNSLPATLINLLNYSYSMAKALLEQQGEFYPIGVCIDQEGKTMQRLIGDNDNYPLASVLLDHIQTDFTAKLSSGHIVAYAIVYQAKVTSKQYTDAVNVLIAKFKSIEGEAEGVYYLPYTITDKIVQFLEPWVEQA